MGKTAIQWSEFTWNPLAGCNQISPGCANCYAKAQHDMRHRVYLENNGFWPITNKPMPLQYALPFETIQLFPERLATVLKRREPTVWFANSVSDLFHDDVPLDFIKRVFDVMNQAERHTFQVLTKRENRLYLLAEKKEITWTPNIWQGVSIESDRYSYRANFLRFVPAKIRFLSCEPLLSDLPSLFLGDIHWVIAGAESGRAKPGKKIRPMDIEWVRNLRDRCQDWHIPFFLKQFATPDGRKIGTPELDGRQWMEMPEVEGAVA
jgi:protein gp37